MTENKRFIVQERCVVDTNDNETFEFSFKVDAEIICEKLNKIEKENKELKTEVDFYKYFQKDARELEKENEQLKIKLEDIALENENAKESNDDAQYELYKLKKENEQLKQLLNEAEDIIMCQCTPHYQRQWENIKKNLKGDVE